MGIVNSLEIFQEKMSNLLQGFDFIHAHIDELLVLTKHDWNCFLELNITKQREALLIYNIIWSLMSRFLTGTLFLLRIPIFLQRYLLYCHHNLSKIDIT